MKNEDMPACPVGVAVSPLGDVYGMHECDTGFTKRERVVLDLMCALVSSNDIRTMADVVAEDVASDAACLADAYFKELES